MICQPDNETVMTPEEITRAVLGKMGQSEAWLWEIVIPVKEAVEVMGSWPHMLGYNDDEGGVVYVCWVDLETSVCVSAYPDEDGLEIYEWCVRSNHGFGEASSLEGACQEWRESMRHSQRKFEAEMLWALPSTGEKL